MTRLVRKSNKKRPEISLGPDIYVLSQMFITPDLKFWLVLTDKMYPKCKD